MTRVLISGTFDVIHPGHIHYIQEAQKLGDEIHVIVACDTNCHLRGKIPIFSEQERLFIVSNLQGISQAHLGREDNDHFAMLREIKPDIILYGYDQTIDDSFHKEISKSASLYQDNYGQSYSSSLIKHRIYGGFDV